MYMIACAICVSPKILILLFSLFHLLLKSGVLGQRCCDIAFGKFQKCLYCCLNYDAVSSIITFTLLVPSVVSVDSMCNLTC